MFNPMQSRLPFSLNCRLRNACRKIGMAALLAGLCWPAYGFANPEPAPVEPAPEVKVVSAPTMDEDDPVTASPSRLMVAVPQPECPGAAPVELPPHPRADADRILAGHRFLLASSQRSALVSSHFAFEQAVFALDIPRFATGSDGTVHDVATEGLGEWVGFSLKVADVMSVDAAGIMRIQHGPDAPSLLFRGAAYQIGGVIGATFRLFRDEELGAQVSLRPWFSYTSSQTYSVLAFVEGASEISDDASADEVLKTSARDYFLAVTSEKSAGASLLVAYTWHEAVGAQASLDVAWSEQESDRTNSEHGGVVTTDFVMAAVAGSAEYDFRSQGLPLGLMVEYKVTYGRLADNPFPTESSRLSHRLGMGAFYTGRDDLQLGFTYSTLLGLPRLTGTHAQNPEEEKLSDPAAVRMVAFNLYYFW